VTFGPDATKMPEAKGVVDKIRSGGYEPEGYTLYTYAAIQTWAEAAKRAKSVDPAKVAAELRKGEFPTVVGKVSFDAKGDRTSPYYVFYTWTGGKTVESTM